MTVYNIEGHNKDKQAPNCLIEATSMAYGSVPAAYGTLKDYGTALGYTKMIIVSTLNQDVTLKSTVSSDTIPVPAGSAITLDDFNHYSIIQIKYDSAAPTSGSIAIYSY